MNIKFAVVATIVTAGLVGWGSQSGILDALWSKSDTESVGTSVVYPTRAILDKFGPPQADVCAPMGRDADGTPIQGTDAPEITDCYRTYVSDTDRARIKAGLISKNDLSAPMGRVADGTPISGIDVPAPPMPVGGDADGTDVPYPTPQGESTIWENLKKMRSRWTQNKQPEPRPTFGPPAPKVSE